MTMITPSYLGETIEYSSLHACRSTLEDPTTFVTAGSQTLTATDTLTASITGAAAVTINATSAAHLTLTGPSSPTAGQPFSLTATIKDQFGNTAANYLGILHFTTTDTAATSVLPADYRFVAADSGTHIFAGATLVTAGNQTITATDTVSSAITGNAVFSLTGPVATHLGITAPANSQSGTAFTITVTALSTGNTTATGYTGAIHFATSATSGFNAIPADYTFVAADKGIHVFVGGVTLSQVGNQALSATDTSSSSITGSAVVTVISTALPDLVVDSTIQAPANAIAGQNVLLAWTDRNSGAGAALGPWVDSVSVSTSASGSSSNVVGSFPFPGLLAPGATAQRTEQIPLPATGGPYFFVVTTNATQTVAEGPNAGNDTTVSAASIALAAPLLPDLTVSSIAPLANSFVSGTSVPVSFKVTNQGTGPTTAPVWQDLVILSQDANLAQSYNGNNSQILFSQPVVQSFPNPSFLGAGLIYSQSVSVPLPISAQGTWYVYVVTDATSAMAEVSRTDKLARSASFTVTLSPLPDLKVTNVRVASQVFTGQAVTVTWTVTNSGNFSTTAGAWTDAVYISANQTLDPSATLLGTFGHTGDLVVGASYTTDSQSVTIPVTFLPVSSTNRTFYFLVQTDTAGAVFQGTTNNKVSAPVTVTVNLTPPPDLKVPPISAPPGAQPSHVLSFTYTVTNGGAGGTPNTNWTDSYYLSPTPTYNAGTALFLGQYFQQAGLVAGASYTRTISVTLPQNVTGSQYVLLDTDSSNVVYESDETNNWSTSGVIQITSTPPDLVVTAASAPAKVLAGSAALVNWTVTNQGTGNTAVNSWQDNVYADTNATLDANAVLVGTFPHFGLLSPGASYNAAQLVTVPINFLGNYNLFVVTNATGNVPEANTANDASTPAPIAVSLQLQANPQAPVQVAPVAGLHVTSVTASTSAAPGTSPTVTWTVTNNGPGATDSNYWYDDVWISTHATLGSGGTDVYLATLQHTNPLAAGASYTASTTVALPQTVAAGNYFFIVTTDRPVPPPTPTGNQGVNLVYSGTTSTANKQAAASVPTAVQNPPAADLTVSNVLAPATATSGQSLTVSWKVTNSGGDTGIVGITDEVYLSLDQIFDPSDHALGYVTTSGGLTPGASYTQQATLPLPPGLTGTYYVFVQTNASGGVYELNTANNTAYQAQPLQINVPPMADLVAGSVTQLPASALAGQQISVTYQVTNSGGNPANGTWYDSLYLSPTPQWALSDPLLGQVTQTHSQPLAAGASYTGTLTATVPGVTPGLYYVILRANILNNLVEATTTNNQIASAAQVAIDAPLLAIGTPATGTLINQQALYYKVNAVAGQTLQLALTTTSTKSFNELYVSFGTMPSRNQYDQRYPAAGGNQTITIPVTQAGNYYVLAYGAGVPAGGEPYSLTASIIPFAVQAVVPSQVGAGPVTLEIDGSKFDANTTFQLLGPNNTVAQSKQVQLQDSSTAFATFDLTNLPTGSYDVLATQTQTGGTSIKLPQGLTVAALAPAHLQTYLSVPDGILPGRQGVATVNFINQGNTDLQAPLLQLTAANALLGLQDQSTIAATSVWFMATSSTGPAGILRPGESGQVSINFLTTGSVGQSIAFNLESADDGQTIDWASQQAALQPPTIPDVAWPAVFNNFVANVGSTVATFHSALAGDATTLSQLGQPTYDVQKLLSLEIANANVAFPVLAPTTATDDTLSGAGFALTFQRTASQSIAGRDTRGMLGYGWTSNWDIAATADALGNVTIVDNGAILYYALQSNGSYLPANGDGSILTFANAAYRLTQANGTIIQFNPNGTLAVMQDAAGNTVTAVYNVAGQLSTLTDSNGTSYSLAYNSQGLLSQLTDSNSQTVTYGYSATGSFLTSVSSAAGTSSYTYVTGQTAALNNALATITLPNSSKVSFSYNAQGRLIATSNGNPSVLGGVPQIGPPIALPSIPFVTSAQDVTPIIVPIDPNNIIGPAGAGPENWVGVNQVLNYTISFENLATALAPARVITITENLDPNLDWGTFRLGNFNFGGLTVTDASNEPSFQKNFTLAGGIVLQVTMNIDEVTGKATWFFQTTDPTTGQVPGNLTVGALPPNTAAGNGQGYVTYSVKPKQTDPTGTVIGAQATVLFDAQAPINTAEFTNTIDADTGLSSTVAALPATEATDAFPVAWSGTDAANGSAVSAFNIFASDNGGPFTAWLQNTTLTSAAYVGQDGHSYGFYSVAVDNAGDVQANSLTAIASTVVHQVTTQLSLTIPPTATAGNAVTCTVTALDASGATDTGYSGTVHFTSSDSSATLPPDATLASGAGAFSIMLKTTGSQTIAAADTAAGSVSGTGGPTVVSAGPVDHFAVSAPAAIAAGAKFNFTITALDKFNNTAAGYSGTVHFASSDIYATLPNNTTLTNGTGVFTATLATAGTQTLTAADAGATAVHGAAGLITVSPGAAVRFAVNAPASISVGSGFSFTVTAQDQFYNTAASYTGTVHFTSSDKNATLPPAVPLAAGSGVFTATLQTSGKQDIAAYDSVTPAITGMSVPITVLGNATHFLISVPGSAQAGSGFIFTVTALDASNNVAAGYGGTVHLISSDGQAGIPAIATLTGGVGVFAGALKTAGNQTISAADTITASIAGTSPAVTVSAVGANRFTVSATSNAVTGIPLSFTVKALDQFGNAAVSYSGTVHFTSTDSSAALPANTTLTAGSGVFNATLKSPGTQTISAIDAGNAVLSGTSNSIAVLGLVVTNLTPTSTGFVAVFNKPLDPSQINLYDSQGTFGADDVVLTGPGSAQTSFHGSLIIDPTNTTITFVKTSSFSGANNFNPSTGVLAAGTYTVTFRSAANGFKDLLGGLLDGNADGVPGDNYSTTFVVSTAPAVVVGVPGFARGPDSNHAVNLPNNQSAGIPINLSNGSNVTSGTFTLQYNSALLNITGATVNSALPGATLTLAASSTPGKAVIDFASLAPLTSGVVRLGELIATVPNSAASAYKTKALLHFSSVQLNGGAISVTPDDAVQVIAYFGDVTGDATLSTGDASLISRVATGVDNNPATGVIGGFAAYQLADPALIGDLNSSGNVDASDVTLINSFLSGTPRSQIPAIPAGLTIVPTGPDPALSFAANLQAMPGATVLVPLQIDTARPQGSSGMTEAVFAVRYDPAVFTVSAADVQLGSLPLTSALLSTTGQSGWQLQAAINSQTGELGIDLFGGTAIATTVAGTLVTIAFHVRDDAPVGTSELSLVTMVNPTGQRAYQTTVSDAEGAFILHPAITDQGSQPGAPGFVAVANNQLDAGPLQIETTPFVVGQFIARSQAEGSPPFVVGQFIARSPTTNGDTLPAFTTELSADLVEQIFARLETLQTQTPALSQLAAIPSSKLYDPIDVLESGASPFQYLVAAPIIGPPVDAAAYPDHATNASLRSASGKLLAAGEFAVLGSGLNGLDDAGAKGREVERGNY